MLQTLPHSPERTQAVLALYIALGPPLQTTKGPAAPEVGHVYVRALELCGQAVDSPHRFPVLWGLWWFHLARAEHRKAQELAEQLFGLAEHAHDSALILQAHHASWTSALFCGDVVPAYEHATLGMRIYDVAQHSSQALTYGGHDPGVCCRMFGAITLWLLGYPDQALERSTESFRLAQELSHPHSQTVALRWAAWLHHCRGEPELVQKRAEAIIQLATKEGISFWLTLGSVLQAWALGEQDQWRDIEPLQQSITKARNVIGEWWVPYHLTLLAEACGRRRQEEEGLTLLA